VFVATIVVLVAVVISPPCRRYKIMEGSVTVVVVLGATVKQSQASEINDCGTDCSPGMLNRDKKECFCTLKCIPGVLDLCAVYHFE
jgi:hypothetical protein